MGLSSDLISQFVKATNDNADVKNETSTVYGTVKEVNGQMYVQFDGSTTTTPVSTTVKVKNGDRVMVMIKNHAATITGNLTDNSASDSDTITNLGEAGKKITELEIAVAERVTTEQLNAVDADIRDTLTADKAVIQESLKASAAEIANLKVIDADIKGRLDVNEASITDLEANKLGVEEANMTYATIENLNATNESVNNLQATHAEFANATADNFKAVDADIYELDTKKLDAESAKVIYANIDFSNIGIAAIEELFSKSGMIDNLTVGEGTVTGKLVGVTISGDLIEGNTIKAEKLVVKGSDGIYYKLNIEAGATTSEQVSQADLQNGLHGTAIIAKTITAEKISVSDLVAFGATIGGFHITDSALYSGAKTSATNTTRGVYLDSTGQMTVGDSNNFITYYKDSDGNYRLEISADSILFGSSHKNIETVVDEVDHAQSTADGAYSKATDAQSAVDDLVASISMLVTDGNGASLMTQTENGWTFSTGDIQSLVNEVSDGLGSLTEEVGSVSGAVDVLQEAVSDLGKKAEYVHVTTYEDEPCVELGETDSDFKLRITNTRMMFTEGSIVLGYFTNQAFNSKKVVIEEELHQAGFVWKRRSNKNYALMWKGDDE